MADTLFTPEAFEQIPGQTWIETGADMNTYPNGLTRPTAMRNLPDWALRQQLARYAGPALEAARDEAHARDWQTD